MTASAEWIYLASQSPRRAQLLQQLGVAHRLLLPTAHEDAEALELHRPGEGPADYVQRVTQAKFEAALQRLAAQGLPPGPVLCADTTVALGRQILGKPLDANEARATLSALSDRTHRVLTAVVLGSAHAHWHALSVTHVRFERLPPSVIERYVSGGEPFGKAGAYAIQGPLAGWISRIEGSHSGVMGLPLCSTARLLDRAGVRWSLAA